MWEAENRRSQSISNIQDLFIVLKSDAKALEPSHPSLASNKHNATINTSQLRTILDSENKRPCRWYTHALIIRDIWIKAGKPGYGLLLYLIICRETRLIQAITDRWAQKSKGAAHRSGLRQCRGDEAKFVVRYVPNRKRGVSLWKQEMEMITH